MPSLEPHWLKYHDRSCKQKGFTGKTNRVRIRIRADNKGAVYKSQRSQRPNVKRKKHDIMIVLRQDSRNVETKFRNIQILPEDPESHEGSEF